MSYQVRSAATMGAYGDLEIARGVHRPLDWVTARITGRAQGDQRCRVRVCDSRLQPYFEAEVTLENNQGTLSFRPVGALGVHWAYLYFPDAERHQRYTNFLVDCETAIQTGNPAYDDLYLTTKEALLLGRRAYQAEKGAFVGYISGDTWQINGVWLRDWIYQMSAYQYWEHDITCGLDRFLEAQLANGSMPDGIRSDGSTWRMAVESDVEYILVLGVWGTWKITGDDRWLAEALPKLQKALAYIESDDKRWDQEHDLVKRGHTCDTWDFEIHESSDFSGKRFVVATCDQSGYYRAYQAMAEMHQQLGQPREAEQMAQKAEDYRRRANALLWDGVKYQHHVHLTPIDHGDFDERQQLAMGNTWAMTRGLADQAQAVSIIHEYRRRYAETGDAYPWWSLQPGYPDELGYYEGAYAKQGGYANGGLMPWVGGELCRAALQHGEERYGVELYEQYIAHLRRSGNRVHVWFWPNGQPGFRTTNEVPYTGWGMSEWLRALVEGLAGFEDQSGQMRVMSLSPRWAATAGANRTIRAAVRYAASETYTAYRLSYDDEGKRIGAEVAGTGEEARFHLLLPNGWHAEAVTVNGQQVAYQEALVESSRYVDFVAPIHMLGEASVQCR